LLHYWNRLGFGARTRPRLETSPVAVPSRPAMPPLPPTSSAPAASGAPEPALFTGRNFECIEEGVPKFWAVEVVGKEVVVRFGRVGMGGQVQRKAFISAAAANLERDRLIASKLAKGYAEKSGPG
jgi:predicted DNA-binding WGR domain protein